ncbi:MAG: trypsin-like peptidase domain-containing protein [Chloroflexota bacterium]
MSTQPSSLALIREGAPGARPVFISARGVRVGRDPSGEVAVNDPQVSRRHAFVWAQAGRTFARDEGSANGTFVNGQRVAGNVELHQGDQLRVGQTTFVLQPMIAPAANPLMPLAAIGAVVVAVIALLFFTSRPAGDQPLVIATASPNAATTSATSATAATAATATATRPPAPAPTAVPTATMNPSQRLVGAQRATVQLRTRVSSTSGASGSGSIVNARGLILTNFHVVGDPDTGAFYNAQKIVEVAITKLPDGEPEWRYRATPIEWDVDLDLAVLRITADLNGRAVSGLSLPIVLIGDSDALTRGDHIHAIGYPSISGGSLTLTEGTVSSFTPGVNGRREWIISDVEVNRGNSGGLAVDDDGRLVGVPSVVKTDSSGGRTIGKLSFLRPINLALPLIKRAEAKL